MTRKGHPMKKLIILALLLTPIHSLAASDCIDLGNPSAMETERSSNYVYYSLQIDAKNECGSDAKVYITVIGKTFDGYELASNLFSAEIPDGDRLTLTDTLMVPIKNVLNIRDWEVKEVAAYKR